MAESTTILFVPGAFHNPSCYDSVAALLKESGYGTDSVHLPSVGPVEYLTKIDKDVEQIKSQIERLADAGQKVVVVVHSYGGVPSSQAIKDLDIATRQKEGKKGGVVHLFYCCSFVIPAGTSLKDALGGREPPWYQISADELSVTPANPELIFYNDMSEEDAKAAVAKLKPHSLQTMRSAIDFAAWKVVPCTYLYCTKDNAIPLQLQKMMVEEFAKGIQFRTEEIDASHSPFYSRPEETAAAIRRAAELSL